MNNDSLAIFGGAILSTAIAQMTAADMDMGIFEVLRQLSATGVLAIVFWWVTQRLEKRLDEAFRDCHELNQKLLELLTKEKEDDHE